MRYIQLMHTTRFVVFQQANFFLFVFSRKYLITFVAQTPAPPRQQIDV